MHTAPPAPALTRETLYILAGRFHVDPRSIRKESERPGSVSGSAGERARAALRAALANTPTPAAWDAA